jgi:hypothetical protein
VGRCGRRGRGAAARPLAGGVAATWRARGGGAMRAMLRAA